MSKELQDARATLANLLLRRSVDLHHSMPCSCGPRCASLYCGSCGRWIQKAGFHDGGRWEKPSEEIGHSRCWKQFVRMTSAYIQAWEREAALRRADAIHQRALIADAAPMGAAGGVPFR